MLILLMVNLFSFLPPDDPNFIVDFARCVQSPDCNEVEYMVWVRDYEKAAEAAAWIDVWGLKLMAVCDRDRWLQTEVVEYDHEYPFDPKMAGFWADKIAEKLEGDGWKYTLTVTRRAKDDWWYRIKITRPVIPYTMNDVAELSREWLFTEKKEGI